MVDLFHIHRVLFITIAWSSGMMAKLVLRLAVGSLQVAGGHVNPHHPNEEELVGNAKKRESEQQSFQSWSTITMLLTTSRSSASC